MIKIIAAKNITEAGSLAAEVIGNVIREKPDCVVGRATGSSPLPVSESLITLYQTGILNFSAVRTFNLDEYVGLESNHPQSYHRFMMDNLFSKINIEVSNIRIPNGLAVDTQKACEEYEKMIEQRGGIDLQLLGIGLNGHIGFNEPTDYFPTKTHLVQLTENTREANRRFFDDIDEVPTHAITMGIGTIMQARKTLLMVTGKAKAAILEQALFGNVQPQIPASILQFHQNLTVVADEPALSVVREKHPRTLST